MPPAEAFREIAGRSHISAVQLRNIGSDVPARCVFTGRSEEYGVHNVLYERLSVRGRTLAPSDMEMNEFVSVAPSAESNSGSCRVWTS